LPIPIKTINKNVIVMDDEMENIMGNKSGNLCADFVILSVVTWENIDPTMKSGAEQEFAVGFFCDLVKSLLDQVRILSSDMD
jgi:hypothetical protein